MSVPRIRIRNVGDAPVRPERDLVLYWMIATRRTGWNFGLQRAVELARELGKPLLVLEALRSDYDWASDRLHRFVIDGMQENAARFHEAGIAYYPWVEPARGAGKGLLRALAARACAVVTDDFPTFFLPRMVQAAARRIDVRLEAVDSNGLLPMRAADRVFVSAYQLRRFLQKNLGAHLDEAPLPDPLADTAGLRTRGTSADARLEALGLGDALERWRPSPVGPGEPGEIRLDALPIDHAVAPVSHRGGSRAARARLTAFLDHDLAAYGERRNDPERDCASRLSDYLHFGHVSVHEILQQLADRESWTPADVSDERSGKRSGWWRMSPAAESFLDEVVTWRELGYNFCSRRQDHDRYESLPDWAQATLADHAGDVRPRLYTAEQFESAATHDELWNAAQNQLRSEGRIHNYLRMLWGKKILHWSESPLAALEIMIHLNNKYATDGRNPNSYSGIFWCLGRYDRPWGPEREVFGKIRYMTSGNTRKKLSVDGYIRRWAHPAAPRQAGLPLG